MWETLLLLYSSFNSSVFFDCFWYLSVAPDGCAWETGWLPRGRHHGDMIYRGVIQACQTSGLKGGAGREWRGCTGSPGPGGRKKCREYYCR